MKKITKGTILSGIPLLVVLGIILSIKQPVEKQSIQTKIQTEVNSQLTSIISEHPLRFISNRGQAGPDANFHVQGAGHTVLFYPDKIELRRSETQLEHNEIALQFEGANQNPVVEGQAQLSGVAHFYNDPDPEMWQTNVPTFASVRYKELYPGIDMTYIGEDGILESEFHVASGSDYRQIRINYQGVKSLNINDRGELILQTGIGKLVEKAPYAYQEIEGVRSTVEARYEIQKKNTIGFHLDKHDPDYPVVIDPELIFFTTIEASSSEWTTGVVLDSEGNLVLSGGASRFFPALDTIEESNHVGGFGSNCWLVKLDGATGEVIYSALLGGGKADVFQDIAIDSSDNLYLTGLTASVDFPTLNPAQEQLAGNQDATLVIFNSDGELTYSTFLGGTSRDLAEGIALDGNGNIFIAGHTRSEDFPEVGGLQLPYAGDGDTYDIFVAKFNPERTIDYSTIFGGEEYEYFGGIAVDLYGRATITGQTLSSDFPISEAYQATFAGGSDSGEGDMFITRINQLGDELIYSTFFGGTDDDWSTGVVIGPDGDVHVSGVTSSEDFPVVNGESFPQADSSDGTLIKLDNLGLPLYSIRTNKSGPDRFDEIAMGDTATIILVGAYKDTIGIFSIRAEDSMRNIFEFSEPGFGINGVNYADGYLAFTGTYWPPDVKKSTKSTLSVGSEEKCGVIHLGNKYDVHIGNDSHIWIEMNRPGKMKVGRDEEGNVAITSEAPDGTKITESTGIKVEEVKSIEIFGTDGDDEIDCRGITKEAFPEIIESGFGVRIHGRNGDNVMFGSNTSKNALIGGSGDDAMHGGTKNDHLDGGGGVNLSEAGHGDDALFIIETLFNPQTEEDSKSTNINSGSGKHITNAGENTNVAIDAGGNDTLHFFEYSSGIALDLMIVNEAQTIDNSGSMLIMEGLFEVVHASDFDDEITVSPLPDTARHIDGRDGTDVLNYYTTNTEAFDDGSAIITAGFAAVSYANMETVNIFTEEVSTEISLFTTEMLEPGISYPNPFTYETIIQFHLTEVAKVKVSIFDISGKLVRVLINQSQQVGTHSILWDGKNDNGIQMANGTYITRIESNGETAGGKVILKR